MKTVLSKELHSANDFATMLKILKAHFGLSEVRFVFY